MTRLNNIMVPSSILLILSIIIALLVQTTFASCESCCLSGNQKSQCKRAYADETSREMVPGICCGYAFNNGIEQPFCCDSDAHCTVQNNRFICLTATSFDIPPGGSGGESTSTGGRTRYNPAGDVSASDLIWILVVSILAFLIFASICTCIVRNGIKCFGHFCCMPFRLLGLTQIGADPNQTISNNDNNTNIDNNHDNNNNIDNVAIISNAERRSSSGANDSFPTNLNNRYYAPQTTTDYRTSSTNPDNTGSRASHHRIEMASIHDSNHSASQPQPPESPTQLSLPQPQSLYYNNYNPTAPFTPGINPYDSNASGGISNTTIDNTAYPTQSQYTNYNNHQFSHSTPQNPPVIDNNDNNNDNNTPALRKPQSLDTMLQTTRNYSTNQRHHRLDEIDGKYDDNEQIGQSKVNPESLMNPMTTNVGGSDLNNNSSHFANQNNNALTRSPDLPPLPPPSYEEVPSVTTTLATRQFESEQNEQLPNYSKNVGSSTNPAPTAPILEEIYMKHDDTNESNDDKQNKNNDERDNKR